MNVDILKRSGRKRNNFAYLHNYSEKYIYIVGGEDTVHYESVNWAQKYNTYSKIWEEMPNMRTRRMGPGIFQSRDEKYIYVFGGKSPKIERILKESDKSWETLNV
jgi:hypothetical protein